MILKYLQLFENITKDILYEDDDVIRTVSITHMGVFEHRGVFKHRGVLNTLDP